MNIRYIVIFFLLVTSTICAQSLNKELEKLKKEDFPKRHIHTYAAGDSIKNLLISSGVDTIILYYRTKTGLEIEINKDQTDDSRSCFLLWKKSGNIFIQRVNDFTVYKEQIVSRFWNDPFYLFQFYLNNANEIQNEFIQSKPRYIYDETQTALYRLSRSRQALTILDYKIGDTTRRLFWADLNANSYQNQSNLFYEDLNKRLVTWVLLVIILPKIWTTG
jgi:hypothetical protein